MAINENALTKGQQRKLNALRKSVGDKLADETFAKWLKQATANVKEVEADPVAEQIAELLKPLEKTKLNLGRHGYSVVRARGKGAKGIVVTRIEKT